MWDQHATNRQQNKNKVHRIPRSMPGNDAFATKCGVGGVFVSLGGTLWAWLILCWRSVHCVTESSIGQNSIFHSFPAISECFSAYQARTRCLRRDVSRLHPSELVFPPFLCCSYLLMSSLPRKVWIFYTDGFTMAADMAADSLLLQLFYGVGFSSFCGVSAVEPQRSDASWARLSLLCSFKAFRHLFWLSLALIMGFFVCLLLFLLFKKVLRRTWLD